MTKIAEQEYLAMGLHIKLLKDQVARLERLMEKIRITKELPPEGEE